MPILDDIQAEAEEQRIQEEYEREVRRMEELERKKQEQRRIRQINKKIKEQVAREGRGLSGLGGDESGLVSSTVRRAGKAAGKAAKRRIAAGAARLAAVAAPYVLPVVGIGLAVLVVIFLVLTTMTALCNAEGYTGALTKVTSAAVGFWSGQDYCEQLSGLEGVVSSIDQTQDSFCSTPQFLAQQNNVPYPRQNDPDLDELIRCISGRVSGAGRIFTFDESAATCNYTRGVETCQRCSHSQNSCHYGGGDGRTGSLAVDFGGQPGAGNEGVVGAAILRASAACSAELSLPVKRAACENESGEAVVCADPGASHIHISLGKCDRDNGPVNLQ